MNFLFMEILGIGLLITINNNHTIDMKYQPPDKPVDVSQFTEHHEYDGIFQKGARNKRLYISPESCDIFLKPNHYYLFKQSWSRHPKQFWAEVVAYKVGDLFKVEVPPTFVSFRKDPYSGEVVCGALIEWFYDPDSPDFHGYKDAGDFLDILIEDFDRKHGSQHNFLDNLSILQSFMKEKEKYIILNNWIEDFFAMLLFDGIIGNTDRHQDNWGILIEKFDNKRLKLTLSPAYDNGTSLGYEIVDEKLPRFSTQQNRLKYISRGCHHMKNSRDGERIGHLELVKIMVNASDNLKMFVSDFISIDLQPIKESIMELTSFNIPEPLDNERANFMMNLIIDRVDEYKKILNL